MFGSTSVAPAVTLAVPALNLWTQSAAEQNASCQNSGVTTLFRGSRARVLARNRVRGERIIAKTHMVDVINSQEHVSDILCCTCCAPRRLRHSQLRSDCLVRGVGSLRLPQKADLEGPVR